MSTASKATITLAGQVLVVINNKAEGSAPRSVEALATAFRSVRMQRSESP